MAYVLDYAEPDGKLFERVRRLAVLAAKGPASRRMLFEVRCDRGADIARSLGFSSSTAQAIRCMDEHWDGGGYPSALRRDGIPLLARIIGLAQVVEPWPKRAAAATSGICRLRNGRRPRAFSASQTSSTRCRPSAPTAGSCRSNRWSASCAPTAAQDSGPRPWTPLCECSNRVIEPSGNLVISIADASDQTHKVQAGA